MSVGTSTTKQLIAAKLSYGLNMPKAKPKPGGLNAFGAAAAGAGAKSKPNPMANSKLAAVFGSAAEEDDAEETANDKKTKTMDLVRLSQASFEDKRRKKAEREQAAVLAEDATAFEYDAVHDDMQTARKAKADAVVERKKDRTSKYISDLLEVGEFRKREQSIIYERKLLKERAVDDADFEGKEKFVTSGYKQKLQEDALWKEQQNKKAADEEANAVHKRGGIAMHGFMQNLLGGKIAGGASRSKSDAPTAAAPGTIATPAAAAAAAAAAGGGGGAVSEADLERDARLARDKRKHDTNSSAASASASASAAGSSSGSSSSAERRAAAATDEQVSGAPLPSDTASASGDDGREPKRQRRDDGTAAAAGDAAAAAGAGAGAGAASASDGASAPKARAKPVPLMAVIEKPKPSAAEVAAAKVKEEAERKTKAEAAKLRYLARKQQK